MIIAITGASGSGKSRLRLSLSNLFGADNVVYLSTDNYYKGRTPDVPMEEYSKRNFDHPNEVLLDVFAEHVKALYEGHTIRRPHMDFEGGTFIRTDNAVEVKPNSIIILEGIFCLQHPSIETLVKEQGYSIFTKVPSALALARVADRDSKERHKSPAETIATYTGNVMDGYFAFIKPRKNTCDLKLSTWTPQEKNIPDEKLANQVLEGLLSKFARERIEELAPDNSILKERLDALERARLPMSEAACS